MLNEPTTNSTSPHQHLLRIELDDEGGAVYGTKEAYATVAALLLRAIETPKPLNNRRMVADCDLSSLVTTDSDLPDFTLYVVKQLPPRIKQTEAENSSWFGWLILGGIALLVLLAGIGVGAIVNYFWLR